jgi:AraC-like DNA-binding protein
MRYRESAPIPVLAPFVEVLWTLEGHTSELEGEPQRILPDGRTELILHFGDAFARPGGREPLALFAGQLTTQLVLWPTGRIKVLGVRFRPHGASALLLPSQLALSGEILSPDCLSPKLARAIETVRDRTDELEEAAALVQRALVALFEPSRLDARIASVVAEIDRRQGRVSIDELAGSAGMTRRHLERRFQQTVGLSPKRLARIARFQRAVRFLDKAVTGSPVGAVTASVCGYADQAHFIRDFRDLAGCAPTQHLMTKGVLTGFFTR